MRKLFFPLLLSAGLMISGCATLPCCPDSVLLASATTVNIPGSLTATFNITSDQAWVINNIPSWLTVSPSFSDVGGPFTITLTYTPASVGSAPLSHNINVLAANGDKVVVTVKTPTVAVVTGNDHVVVTSSGTEHIHTGELVDASCDGLAYAIDLVAKEITVSYAGANYDLPFYIPADKAVYDEVFVPVGNYVIIGQDATINKDQFGNNIGLTISNGTQSITQFFDAANIPATGVPWSVAWASGVETYTVKLSASDITPPPVEILHAIAYDNGGWVYDDENNVGFDPTFGGNSACIGLLITSSMTSGAIVGRFLKFDFVDFDFGGYGGDFEANAWFAAHAGANVYSLPMPTGLPANNQVTFFDSGAYETGIGSFAIGGYSAGIRFYNPGGAWFSAPGEDATITATIDVYGEAPTAAVTAGAPANIYLGTKVVEIVIES